LAPEKELTHASASRIGHPCRFFAMEKKLLPSRQAAQQLGISRATFYDWLRQSNAGKFVIRGRSVTIDYLQGGGRGQGRILIESSEIDRLMDLMRVHPRSIPQRKLPVPKPEFTWITVPLGRPKI